MLRIEMHYNKMHDLKKYNIVTLSDLTVLSKVRPLVQEITSRWYNIIYYDKSINIKNLTPTQQKRVLYSATPRNWVELGKRQRTRAKKRFNELMNLHGSTTQKDISIIILNKWGELVSEKCIRFTHSKKEDSAAEKCPPFTHPKKKIQQPKSVHLLPVSIDGYKVDKTTLKKTINILPKTTPKRGVILLPIITTKKRVCKNCKTDISHKRTNAKYCSKTCSNKITGNVRTLKNQKIRLQEKEDLKKLLKILPKKRIWLMVSYKSDNEIYTDTLQQKEIQTTKEWIKKYKK
ncbi:hypothetical protein R8G61_12905 [Tenacibaculum maritimum]